MEYNFYDFENISLFIYKGALIFFFALTIDSNFGLLPEGRIRETKRLVLGVKGHS